MTVENTIDKELAEDVLKDAAKELFAKAQKNVKRNKDFKSAIVKRFLENPQGMGRGYDSGRIEFESKGTDIVLNLERNDFSDRIALRTESEGIEQHISIWLKFREKTVVDGVVLAYRKTNWHGDTPTELYANNSVAIEKIRQFLHQI